MKPTKYTFILAVFVLAFQLSLLFWVSKAMSDVRYEIRQVCLEAEDTAAHLRLLEYDGASAKYGCYRRGY